MTIVLPLEHNSITSKLASSFGRANYFMFYDSNTHQSNIIDNAFVKAHGGAGIKASQMLIDQSVDALIVFHVGENAKNVLASSQCKVYTPINDAIGDNITALLEGKLAIYSYA